MAGDTFLLKVTHGHFTHDVQLSSSETVGALKRILVDETMVPADEMRLLFRGREILDLEILKEAGIKNGSKLMLLENLQVKQAKQDARKQDVNHLKAIKAVAAVHSDVDGHEKKVDEFTKSVQLGNPVKDKDLLILSELLMRELLKLDAIQGEGEVKQDRRAAVKRVQTLVDRVDNLRLKASNPAQAPSETVAGDQIKPTLFPPSRETIVPDSILPVPDSIPPSHMTLLRDNRRYSENSTSAVAWNPGMLFTNRDSPTQHVHPSKNPFLSMAPHLEKFDPEPSTLEGTLTSIPSPNSLPSKAAISETSPSAPLRKKVEFKLPNDDDAVFLLSSKKVARKKFSPKQNLSPTQGSEQGGVQSPTGHSRKLHQQQSPSPPQKESTGKLTPLQRSPSAAEQPSPSIADSISTFAPSSLPQSKSLPTSDASKKFSRKLRLSPSLSLSPSPSKDSLEEDSKSPPDEVSTFPKSALPKPQILAARISRLAAEQRAKSAEEASKKVIKTTKPQSDEIHKKLNSSAKVEKVPKKGLREKGPGQVENKGKPKTSTVLAPNNSISLDSIPEEQNTLHAAVQRAVQRVVKAAEKSPSPPAAAKPTPHALSTPKLTSQSSTHSSLPLPSSSTAAVVQFSQGSNPVANTNPFAVVTDDRSGEVSAVGLNPFESRPVIESTWERF